MDSRTFLESFFGPGNQIALPSLRDGTLASEDVNWLEPWIEDLHDEQQPTVVLPRLTSSGETIWYALAFSQRQARTLREDLMAFLGPTLTDFDGSPPPPPENDLEASVAQLTNGNYFRLRVPRGVTAEERSFKRQAVRESISLMRELRRRRPERQPPVVRQVGRILRDFEWTLRASDTEGSLACLGELKASGRVSALNLAYLRTQRFSALGNSRALLADRDLPEVLQSRRPALVTEAILGALYEEYFQQFDSSSEADEALHLFRTDVATPFAALFRGRGSLDSDSVRTMFMLWASVEPVKEELRREILALEGPHPSLVEGLAQVASHGTVPRRGPLQVAEAALDEGAFESALRALKVFDGESQELAELALRCAYELETKESAIFAIERYRALGDVISGLMEESRTTRTWIDSALQLVSLPGSWRELVGTMNSGDPILENAARWAKASCFSWDSAEFSAHGHELQDLILVERDAMGQSVFRDVLPYMVNALDDVDAGASDPAVRAVHESLVLHLATRQGLGAAELDGLLDLIRVLFDTGVDYGEYTDLVETLTAIWTHHESRRWFGWLLEAGELVVAYPPLNAGAANAFAGSVLASCLKLYRHLGDTEREVAKDLLLQFDMNEESVAFLIPERPRQEIALAADISSKYVAVYTLARGVGERVKRLLEDAYPGIDVRVNSDHAGSLPLRDMSRNADVFVVATRAAKHAATEFIRQHRPTSMPTLYPRGKGSSSIIEALREWAEEGELAA